MRNAATPGDGNHSEMDELDYGLGAADDAEARVPGLAEAFRETTDETTAVAMASRAVAMQVSLAKGTAGASAVDHTVGAAGGFGGSLKHLFGSLGSVFGRSGVKAAVGVAAVLSVTGGLAAADVLPDPIQEPISEVARVVGINLPAPDDDTENLLAVEADDESDSPDKDDSAPVAEEPGKAAVVFDEGDIDEERFDDPDPDPDEDEFDEFDEDDFDEFEDENDELEERIEELEEQASELEEQAAKLRAKAAGLEAEEAAELLANADALDALAADLRDEADMLAAVEDLSFSLNEDEDEFDDDDNDFDESHDDESDDDDDDNDDDDGDDDHDEVEEDDDLDESDEDDFDDSDDNDDDDFDDDNDSGHDDSDDDD